MGCVASTSKKQKNATTTTTTVVKSKPEVEVKKAEDKEAVDLPPPSGPDGQETKIELQEKPVKVEVEEEKKEAQEDHLPAKEKTEEEKDQQEIIVEEKEREQDVQVGKPAESSTPPEKNDETEKNDVIEQEDEQPLVQVQQSSPEKKILRTIAKSEEKFSHWLFPDFDDTASVGSSRRSLNSTRLSIRSAPPTEPVLTINDDISGFDAFSHWLIPGPMDKKQSTSSSFKSRPMKRQKSASAKTLGKTKRKSETKDVLVNPMVDDFKLLMDQVKRLKEEQLAKARESNAAKEEASDSKDGLEDVRVRGLTEEQPYTFRVVE